MHLRWLGNNAWQISFGTTTILIEPWLTRFKTGTYTPEGIRDDTSLTVDPTRIDPYIGHADVVLVSHGHYDHMTDVPYIAGRTGATVLGTESHHNMLRARGAQAQPVLHRYAVASTSSTTVTRSRSSDRRTL